MIILLWGGFAAIILVDLLNPQWSSVELMASYFVHARAGWLITVALLALAVGSALATRRIARRPEHPRAAVIALSVWTLGVLGAAAFPADPPGAWDNPSTANLIHGAAGMVAFLALPVAATILRERAVPVWIAYGAFLVTWIDVFDGPSLSVGPYASLAGLTERVMVAVYLLWLTVAARKQHGGGA